MQKNTISGSRIHVGTQGYIESIDTSQITPEQIQRIYEIEQDMWAHGLGSYIGCNNCEKISCKDDLYGYLEKTLRIKTVHEIEAILGIGCPDCPACGNHNTYHVFDEKYRDQDITQRYQFNNSFLVTYNDTSGKIKGFINAYISDFDTIYKKEFEPFYGESSKQQVCDKISNRLSLPVPEQIISMNNLGAEQDVVRLPLLYELIKHICQQMEGVQNHLPGIYDSILQNTTHGMYEVSGGKRLKVHDSIQKNTIHTDFQTDIILHENIIDSFLNTLGGSSRQFFKSHLPAIKNIVKS